MISPDEKKGLFYLRLIYDWQVSFVFVLTCHCWFCILPLKIYHFDRLVSLMRLYLHWIRICDGFMVGWIRAVLFVFVNSIVWWSIKVPSSRRPAKTAGQESRVESSTQKHENLTRFSPNKVIPTQPHNPRFQHYYHTSYVWIGKIPWLSHDDPRTGVFCRASFVACVLRSCRPMPRCWATRCNGCRQGLWRRWSDGPGGSWGRAAKSGDGRCRFTVKIEAFEEVLR